jgi:two-component system sensor histidine kinase KdpD
MDQDASIQELSRQGERKPRSEKKRVLVCLSPTADCPRLIQAARRLAESQNAAWFALYVETPPHAKLPPADRERLAHALRQAEEHGAEAHTLSGSHVSEEILRFAKERRITQIIVGSPHAPRWRRLLFGSVAEELLRQGRIDLQVTYCPEERPPRGAGAWPLKRVWQQVLRDYGIAAGSVGLCTSLAWVLFPYLALTNLVMIYLLTVVIIASLLGRGPSIFASVFSVVSFGFFFIPDHFSFNVASTEYAITLGVMLLVSILISGLTVQVRHQAKAARQRERQTAALFAMNRRLTAVLSLEELLTEAVNHISQTFDGRASLLLPDQDGKLTVQAGAPLAPDQDKEWSVARWVYRHGHAAGQGTETLPEVKGLYLPLRASRHVIGVLRLETTHHDHPLASERLRLLEALGGQVALAMERENLRKQAHKVRVEVEAERLRNILLSSVSHDLRTPLTVIAGAASTLVEGEHELDARTKRELAQSIFEEAKRLDRLVHNLLEMSRLQSGEIPLNKDWHVLEEVIGCALVQLDAQLKDRPVHIHLPPDLPLVQIDPLLMERVFVNLLENAVKYTPPQSPVEISTRLEDKDLVMEISDRGPGLPAGEEEKIFEKFYQPAPGGLRGGGLGLAICRSIVEAHGGRIWAANRPGGGATFSLTMPLGEPLSLEEPLVEVDDSYPHEAARPLD